MLLFKDVIRFEVLSWLSLSCLLLSNLCGLMKVVQMPEINHENMGMPYEVKHQLFIDSSPEAKGNCCHLLIWVSEFGAPRVKIFTVNRDVVTVHCA